MHNAARAFETENGSLADRVMAAMEAADEAGGDVRCTCETVPVPDAACDSRNAHVAYILQADTDDPEGASFNDGDYAMYISATDEDIEPHENGNPVNAKMVDKDGDTLVTWTEGKCKGSDEYCPEYFR